MIMNYEYADRESKKLKGNVRSFSWSAEQSQPAIHRLAQTMQLHCLIKISLHIYVGHAPWVLATACCFAVRVSVADPKILKGGGGRQFISSVLIYRKCAKRNICLLHGKSGFLKKKYEPVGGGGRPHRPPPLNPPLVWFELGH